MVIYDSTYGCARLEPLPNEPQVEQYYYEDRFYAEAKQGLEKEKREYHAGFWDRYYGHLLKITRPKTRFCFRVLDYGCGAGWLVDYWQRHTPDKITGFEPSAIAKRYAPQPELIKEPEGLYDIVILHLVLEHVVNPLAFLGRLPLKSGGRLLVVVPNEFNPLQIRAGYKGFVNTVHVNYFTPKTLAGVLGRAGFGVEYTSATFPMELFLLFKMTNYARHPKRGAACHRIRLNFEKHAPGVYRLYEQLFRKWGIGRELIFVGRKK